ncbi:uncharacterized protein LOC123837952 [Mirounga angustirostris]|uniref:uncharacterized protein LOC123837952 n=1 Tax=Mirounga angustirostris TaxID=9716 RepID=UPI00313C9C45
MLEEPIALYQELGLWKIDDIMRDLKNPALKAVVMFITQALPLKKQAELMDKRTQAGQCDEARNCCFLVCGPAICSQCGLKLRRGPKLGLHTPHCSGHSSDEQGNCKWHRRHFSLTGRKMAFSCTTSPKAYSSWRPGQTKDLWDLSNPNDDSFFVLGFFLGRGSDMGTTGDRRFSFVHCFHTYISDGYEENELSNSNILEQSASG